MRTRIFVFLAIHFLFGLQGCIDKCDYNCFTPPLPLWFKIVDSTNEKNLLTENYYCRDSIKIFYIDEGEQKFANIQFVGTFRVNDIIETDITTQLPIDQINTAYLYLNQFDTDTILFRVTKSSDGCCTSFPLDSISINGKPAKVDPTDFSFLIEKQGLN